MGLFSKKKKVPITVESSLKKCLDIEDKRVDNYLKTKPAVQKLIAKYKTSLTPFANIYNYEIRLTLKEEFYTKYPDGFFAFADKLGLNIEPICHGGYSSGKERDFTVRVKGQ